MTIETDQHHPLPIQELERVTIRFAGDSGDGMQLTGTQFTRTAAVYGNDIATLPDFPAEIRAPAGSLAGVSGFQISFSSIGHPHARRFTRRAGGDEPGSAANQRRGCPRRWCHRRQRGRLHQAEPGQGGLCPEPPRGWFAQRLQRLRDPHQQAQRARPRGARHVDQAGRHLQELLRSRRHVLALRALHGADHQVDREEVRRAPGHR